MIATVSTEPTFLYPSSRQFPFDEVCEQIVRALEERNWNVPGITVDFSVYGTGAQKYRRVDHIIGDDFKLWFCRVQGRMGQWNDIAAVTEIVIPRRELHVYDDESGPRYYEYVGKNWEAHKEDFLNGSKVNSKLRGRPRTYIQYEGGCDCGSTTMRHTHTGRRSPLLVFTDDLGREWHRKTRGKRKNPASYRTADVLTEFTTWLQDNLLARILAQPLPGESVDIFQESATPFPKTVGPIFCFGKSDDAYRVHQGKLDSSELEPGDCYGLQGNGTRLLNLLVRNDGHIPEIAYDGFLWCGVGEVTSETPIHTLDVPGHYRWADDEKYVFRITPNRADGVYIADHAPYEVWRKELFGDIKPRDRLTDAELAEAYQVRARTIVPIKEYDGGYEQPIVLINRELGFDEVELVSGPWPECQYVALIANRSPEARQLLEQALSAQESYYRTFREEDRGPYDEALAKLADHFASDQEVADAALAYGRQIHRKMETDVHFMDRLVSAAGTSRNLGMF